MPDSKTNICSVLPNLKLKTGKINFDMRFAGDGNMRDKLDGLISKNKYLDYKTILDFQNEVKKAMGNSHCLVSSPFWESFSVCLIEASVNQRPIIINPIGSTADYLNNTNSYIR
ncbi:glycosyltransferase [Winogradskyella sp. R77965]|uniref:glycosyltransferase n=1 Tax=Winogradskyella sp. R77965 TaxID=3093872 RepID=UPI0037DCA039